MSLSPRRVACLRSCSPLLAQSACRRRCSAQPLRLDTTARAVAAAEAFLATLDEARAAEGEPRLQREDANRLVEPAFRHRRCRSGATERNGLKLGDMTPAQEKAALALVATALSPEGFTKAMAIVDADQVLEIRSAPTRKPRRTHPVRPRRILRRAFSGKPSTTEPWMMQFGGHHLAINVTMAGRENVLAPTHTGAQPASYSVGRQARSGRSEMKTIARSSSSTH